MTAKFNTRVLETFRIYRTVFGEEKTVFRPEHENTVSVDEVNEVEKLPCMITGSAKP